MLRNLYILLICAPLLGAFASLKAQTADAVRNATVEAIRQGKAEALSAYLNKRVDLTVPPGSDGSHDANQTLFILKEFFQNYPIKEFKVLHSGQSENAYYVMGTYVSAKGSFDTNVFIKQIGGNYLIDQIRFENDN